MISYQCPIAQPVRPTVSNMMPSAPLAIGNWKAMVLPDLQRLGPRRRCFALCWARPLNYRA